MIWRRWKAKICVTWDAAGREAGRAAGGIDFDSQIKPILAEHCYRCHDEKTKGGLRLSDRDAALKGGDSELPAVAPGNPEGSYLVELIHPDAGEDRMPPKGEPLPEQDRAMIAEWIRKGASYASAGKKVTPAERTTDLEFLRRVTLDVAGAMPSAEEVKRFLADDPESRRARAIDRLLDDKRWADHWTAYWQDALAENPNILKPSLNNTGPFRFWIHEALADNLPMDRFVTELILMEGSVHGGGPAGFGMAAENDVPMAAKAHILGTAFLGVEMNCARCHDAPYHKSLQKDLFEMAAMLNRGPLKLPASSSVPMSTFEGRKPLIQISLKPGEIIAPAWPAPFAEDFAAEADPALLRNPDDTRERLLAAMRRSAAETLGAEPVADYDAALEESLRLSGPEFMSVFDLASEKADLRNRYGGEFGQRCLLARRLIQRGVRFIEVSHNMNFVNGTGWDTHNQGQLKQHLLIEELDQALSALILDLESLHWLDKTLIVVNTEFGRPSAFDGGGGRGHQGSAFAVVLAGGGLKHCGAYGVTDELSATPVENPVGVPDLFATIHASLGIDPSKEIYDGDRPVPITDQGKPIAALFG